MKAARKKVAKKTAKKAAAKKPAKKAAPKKAAPKKTVAKKPAPKASAPAKSPISNGGPITWNFKLLGHHMLDGFGGMGEGMSIQIAPDGRRIIWLAHESAPKNFTAVDVSDPRKPKVVVQTDLPQAHMRSNSLETCGNIMAVAYQTQKKGLQPAGLELFDISVPEKPSSISFFDCSGPTSRGVHQLWFCDGEYVHCASGAPDFMPTHPLRRPVLSLHRRAQSVEAGRDRPLVDAGHQQGDNVHAAAAASARQGLPRAQHQRLSAASGPLLSRLYRRRHVRPRHLRQGEPEAHLAVDQLAALYRLHAHGGAAVRPRADAGDRRVDREQRQGLAEADLGSRRARRNQPGADLDLPAARSPGLRRGGPLRRPQHPRERAAADLLAFRPDRARHLLQWRLARLRHLQPVPAEGGRHVRAAGAADGAHRARSSSTTCSSTSARSSTRSIVTRRACTSWRWISEDVAMLDLFPFPRGRPVRAPAQARARRARFR